MSYIQNMFAKVAKIALPSSDQDLLKNYWIASIGIRLDSVQVSAKNLGVNVGNINWDGDDFEQIKSYMKVANGHSEVRTLRKMNGGVLFVARISKERYTNNKVISFKMARPCEICEQNIISRRISKVYYTINDNQYGVMYNGKDEVRYF